MGLFNIILKILNPIGLLLKKIQLNIYTFIIAHHLCSDYIRGENFRGKRHAIMQFIHNSVGG
jgi:hypothetical protein